jgi:protein-arginine kinase
MLTTDEGISINDIIQPGLDNPDHPIGVVALSKDCYYTFEDILINIAKTYHHRNIKLAKYEKDNYGIIKSILINLDELMGKTLKEVELSCSRNIDGYLFSGRISRSDRREIQKRVTQFLKNNEQEIFDESGKYLLLENSAHQVPPSEQNQFFRSCGFYRDWPDGRFLYVNNTLSLITNEEDHIKLVQTMSSGNIKNLVSYFNLLEKLEKEFNICYDDHLGYLTSLPTNLGN